MTRLYIVRHAESVHNLENRIQGHQDSLLTARGLRQARCLARRLKGVVLHRIYSSDLGRAVSTMREIARLKKKVPVVHDSQLREIHLGEWEGMTAREVDRLYQNGYQRWLKKPSACPIPGCEGIKDFRRRIVGRVRLISARHRGENVLIMTHGGAITALLAEWMKADFDTLLLNLHLENTGVTIAEDTGARVRLRSINDVSHLR